MREARAARTQRWPALLPVILVLATSTFFPGDTFAQDGQSRRVRKVVLAEEAKVARALHRRDGQALQRSADKLGAIVDEAFARKKKGLQIGSCEFAAQSLIHVALFAAHGLRGPDDWSEVLRPTLMAEARNFQREMAACEREIGINPRDHGGVAKVLRALSKNGKT